MTCAVCVCVADVAAAVRRRWPSSTELEVSQRVSKWLAEAGDRENHRSTRRPRRYIETDGDCSDMEPCDRENTDKMV